MSMYKNSKFKLMYGSNKVKALMFGNSKVWSGASVVSYYDGDTLLGTEEVDEGSDVLHPNISTSKSGYTLVGWTYNDENVTSLVASGEPMTIKAVYVANSITIASGYLNDWGWNGSQFVPYYVQSVWNTDYISGSAIAWDGGYWRQLKATSNFTLNKGYYQTASASFNYGGAKYGEYYSGAPYYAIDGVKTTSASLDNGNHSLYVYQAIDDEKISIAFYITSITLSNPIAWT